MLVGTTYFKLLSPEARRPERHHRGDAGFDLYVSRAATVQPGDWVDVHTDVAIQLPSDVWAEITGRSSTFRVKGLQVQHGVIDSGFRGELFVACYNFRGEPVDLAAGDRIAQLIPHPLYEMVWREAEELDETTRGTGGFGSTGH